MNDYSGPERRESPEGIAERLDNHLAACELQNQQMLKEIRELRRAVQPAIDAITTGRGIVVLLKFIGYLGAAAGMIYAGIRFIRGA